MRHDGRVRFFVDENLGERVARALRVAFPRHMFNTSQDFQSKGYSDVALFEILGNRQVDALITRDKQQLVNTEERDGLRVNNLHWIGIPQPERVERSAGQAMTLATAMLALPTFLGNTAAAPSSYHLRLRRVGEPDAVVINAL